MALRALAKAVSKPTQANASTVTLYRSTLRELPRVMSIYDIDIPMKDARAAVEFHFRQNAHLKDPRVINILIGKGYIELEETLLQWKQKTHLMARLEPYGMKKEEELSYFEQLQLGSVHKFK
mmetsp:Transcript_27417/g.46341  ORF Transcript_27417/g.46341 Transcript_27417/m.46341 type:complete len:122 (+) Transcript_27417:70-435(+)|eukprot:CAMPEP_0114412170 /NCGR_PEP_ID=MMETSP0103-20121206/182_1 /TAXON_ID=37642 ORGANISM="Paraphysomonas imperforata, Strain PA2" /NCGR_SAMPLE_ID=MMETSP0103 /ASSEMBLY_ACC=CAM_ASM_000201 /LENGTH=121 /DNA_ID=CAMNT_0001580167 /DNA_START=51 /DNA_END=416 /DNA_ORIENTATION=+